MKPKHYGIVSFSLCTMGILFSFIYYGYRHGKFPLFMESNIGNHKKISDIKVPDPVVIHKIAGLERRMADFSSIEKDKNPPIDLFIFGVHDSQDLKGKNPYFSGPVKKEINYIISLALRSEKQKLCIIDGNVYEEGQILPDGAKILKIEPQKVLMEIQSEQRWFLLEHPQEKKRLQPSDES